MSSLISWHTYLILNVALACLYLFARLTLSLTIFKHFLSQNERLKYARYCFLSAIISLFVILFLNSFIPTNYQTHFQIEPLLKNASLTLMQHDKVTLQLKELSQTKFYLPFHFSFMNMVCIAIILFFTSYLTNYIKNLMALHQLAKRSFCHHHISNVKLLFSDETDMPCCWSLLGKHFIIIPNWLLAHKEELKLTIRHELQHIRQGDTRWLHLLMLLKCINFWNPFVRLWLNWLYELQEFSCDEAILLRNRVSPMGYAECLLQVARTTLNHQLLPQATLSIFGSSKSILYRRVNMLFQYKKSKMKKKAKLFFYVASSFIALSSAFALNGSSSLTPLSSKEVAAIIDKSHIDKSFQVFATKEVVDEINNIRSSTDARSHLREGLKRMKQYQTLIQSELQKNAMPKDLVVIPLVESSYQPLDQRVNPVLAAGIWQIIPSTAKRFGLVVNQERDDRLDTQLSTKAALTYLNENYQQFHNWKLAFMAYEIGEMQTDQLIKTTGTRDAWTIARRDGAPQTLKKALALFDAELIIMHNPSLIEK